MKPKNKTKLKNIIISLFLIYFFVLSWAVLLKMETDISTLKNMNFRNINLIPFSQSCIVNGKINLSEIILNVIAFVPFGVYISMLFMEWGVFKKVFTIFAVSSLYEILQYIFAIGGSDITDLINNTLGGIIGIVIYFIFKKIFKEKTTKILTILAFICTVVTVLFLALLIIANL